MALRLSSFSGSEPGSSECSSSETSASGRWPLSRTALLDSASGILSTVARMISRSARSCAAKWSATAFVVAEG
eukprot:4938098-Alexandrium_andersonii.AAC.1